MRDGGTYDLDRSENGDTASVRDSLKESNSRRHAISVPLDSIPSVQMSQIQ